MSWGSDVTRLTLLATTVFLSLALSACSAGRESVTPTMEPSGSPTATSGDPTEGNAPFAQSCNPPTAAYQLPEVGKLPSGQRLAWVSEGNLWTLAEDCPWPYRVSLSGISSPQWSPDGDWLAFTIHGADFPGRLWLHPVEGGDSPLRVRADSFVWTPDSQAIVFTFPLGPEEDSDYGIWLGHVDDGSVSKLAEAARSELALSPDGRMVAFWREEPCPPDVVPQPPEGITYQCGTVWSVGLSDGEPQRLAGPTELAEAPPFDVDLEMGISSTRGLQWSPDGEWLIFYACGVSASLCAGTQYIFAVRPDGSGLRYLYTTVGSVDWAPDGSRFVTAEAGRYFDVRPRQLVVIDPESSDALNISPAEVEDREPQWSPQDDLLVFDSSPPVRSPDCNLCPPEVPEQGIWVMRADGSERRQMTSAPDWRECEPQWSADGQWILFVRQGPEYVSDRGFAQTGLWLMRRDGSDLHLLAEVTGPTGTAGVEYDWWTSSGQ